jgi:hypothetical protein
VRQTATRSGTWDIEVSVEQTGEQQFQMTMPLRLDLDTPEQTQVIRDLHIDGPAVATRIQAPAPLRRLAPDPARALLQRTYSAVPGDVNLSGEVDGFDLIDLAIAYRRDIVQTWNGEDYFWPNPGYIPRFDLSTDGHIDEADLTLLLSAAFGAAGSE